MDQLLHIRLDDLEPDPNQPRKDFDPAKLEELAGSIAAVGVKQPISVRKHPNPVSGGPSYMIIAGERRWKASRLAGLEVIPSVIVTQEQDLTEDALYAHQLTENLHRQDLNPVEKAEFIQGRIDYLKANGVERAVDQVASELGVSPAWVSKNTAILKYEPEVRALARDGKLRDYTLLKKISKLRTDKRQKAIDLIERGEFNAKEFFERKRYDKKEKPGTKEDDTVISLAKSKAAEEDKPVLIKMELTAHEWMRLIDRTDYASMLDRHDSDWRKANPVIMKSYVKRFRQWVAETEA